MKATQKQRDEYAKRWEQEHPGFSADRFYLAYLDENNQLKDTPQFYEDVSMLMRRPSFKGATITNKIFKYISQKEINDFVEGWMAKHPGYTPENFTDAYYDNNLLPDDDYWLMEDYAQDYDPNNSDD